MPPTRCIAGTIVLLAIGLFPLPGAHGALGRVFLRYHATASGRVEELDFPLAPGVLAPDFKKTSDRFRHTACVAELAELLRDSYWARDGSYVEILNVLAKLSPEFRSLPEWQEVVELTARAQDITIRNLMSR